MKDIKSYVIGFLTCACLFLIMGATNTNYNKGNGKYQAFGVTNQLYMIDTTDGQLYREGWRGDETFVWRKYGDALED